MAYTTSVHSLGRVKQPSEEERRLNLLPLVGNHQLSKRGFLSKQAAACARHRSLIRLPERTAGWLLTQA